MKLCKNVRSRLLMPTDGITSPIASSQPSSMRTLGSFIYLPSNFGSQRNIEFPKQAGATQSSSSKNDTFAPSTTSQKKNQSSSVAKKGGQKGQRKKKAKSSVCIDLLDSDIEEIPSPFRNSQQPQMAPSRSTREQLRKGKGKKASEAPGGTPKSTAAAANQSSVIECCNVDPLFLESLNIVDFEVSVFVCGWGSQHVDNNNRFNSLPILASSKAVGVRHRPTKEPLKRTEIA